MWYPACKHVPLTVARSSLPKAHLVSVSSRACLGSKQWCFIKIFRASEQVLQKSGTVSGEAKAAAVVDLLHFDARVWPLGYKMEALDRVKHGGSVRPLRVLLILCRGPSELGTNQNVNLWLDIFVDQNQNNYTLRTEQCSAHTFWKEQRWGVVCQKTCVPLAFCCSCVNAFLAPDSTRGAYSVIKNVKPLLTQDGRRYFENWKSHSHASAVDAFCLVGWLSGSEWDLQLQRELAGIHKAAEMASHFGYCPLDIDTLRSPTLENVERKLSEAVRGVSATQSDELLLARTARAKSSKTWLTYTVRKCGKVSARGLSFSESLKESPRSTL